MTAIWERRFSSDFTCFSFPPVLFLSPSPLPATRCSPLLHSASQPLPPHHLSHLDPQPRLICNQAATCASPACTLSATLFWLHSPALWLGLISGRWPCLPLTDTSTTFRSRLPLLPQHFLVSVTLFRQHCWVSFLRLVTCGSLAAESLPCLAHQSAWTYSPQFTCWLLGLVLQSEPQHSS